MIEIKVQLANDVRTLNRRLKQKFSAYPMQIRWAMWAGQEAMLKFLQDKMTEYATQDYYIKPSVVKKAIRIQDYARGARFIVHGKRQMLHNYKLSPTKPGKKPQMLYGAVRRDGGLKPLGSAFLMRTDTGKYIAMRRKGLARTPLEPLIGPAIPQILGDYYDRELKEDAQGIFRAVFVKCLVSVIHTGRFMKDTMMLNSADFRPHVMASGRRGPAFSSETPLQRLHVRACAAQREYRLGGW